ncbi:MAG: hypothetical protein GSR73_05955 [Desulfurococcales archaeon]|nr:hypothetical protein [Desulfurococcales archaeon]
MGRAGEAKAILLLITLSLFLAAKIVLVILKLKLHLWATRRSYTRKFKKSLKGLPKDLVDELARSYDYKLKTALKLSVKDFAKLWRER